MPVTRRDLAVTTGLTLTAAASLCAYASISPTSQLFGRTLVAPPGPDQLLLTFDDGPNPGITPRLLDLLDRFDARATFFLIGAHVRREPALTREIAARGHAVGNHTMHHRYLTVLPLPRVQQELRDCNAALEDALGQPVTLFRPPHGARRPAVLRAAADLGLRTVQFNAIVGDWKPLPPTVLATRITTAVARNRRHNRGTNLVLHDGGQEALSADRGSTLRAVEHLLPQWSRTLSLVQPADCPEPSASAQPTIRAPFMAVSPP